jgi:hypothetical protein
MVEECEHAARVEVLHAEIVRLSTSALLDESQEKPESVAIRGDSPWAEVSLIDEVLAEVALQRLTEQLVARRVRGCHLSKLGPLSPHGSLRADEAKRSNRVPATDSNSPVPLRYQ